MSGFWGIDCNTLIEMPDGEVMLIDWEPRTTDWIVWILREDDENPKVERMSGKALDELLAHRVK